MNLDIDTYPELLLGLDYLAMIVFAWLIVALMCLFSMFLSIGGVTLFTPRFAQRFPEAVGALDGLVMVMRGMTFGMMGLFILYYIWGSENFFMFVLVPQILVLGCVVFLLTEVLRVMMHGHNTVPKMKKPW